VTLDEHISRCNKIIAALARAPMSKEGLKGHTGAARPETGHTTAASSASREC
jgi:hypothetical protein